MMVRPAFQAGVQSGEIALTTKEATVSVFLMISKTF